MTPGLKNRDGRYNGPKPKRATLYDKWHGEDLESHVDKLRHHLIGIVYGNLVRAKAPPAGESDEGGSRGGTCSNGSRGGDGAAFGDDDRVSSGGGSGGKRAEITWQADRNQRKRSRHDEGGGAAAAAAAMSEPVSVHVLEINGDLITCGAGMIVQQCNCIGTDGRGLASVIRKRLPYGDPYSKRRKPPGKRFAVPEDR